MKLSNRVLIISGSVFLLSASTWIISDLLRVNTVAANNDVGDTATVKSDPEHIAKVQEHYRVYSPPIPDNLNIGGEEFPLDELDSYERLQREIVINTFWHSSTIFIFKRAARWFPVIEPILRDEGVPDDLKYLAVIESGLDNVVSPAGARGFWQFMPATAKQYNLEVTNFVDERYHVEMSTRAACKLLKDGYKKFGSWMLSAAAYNMGMGGLQKEMDAQGLTRYVDLMLPEETMRYVYRIGALKQIMSNPDHYGFRMRDADVFQSYRTKPLEVKESITDLGAFAKKNNTTVRLIKILNPWLRSNSLPNPTGKLYVILLPAQDFNQRK